MKSYYHDDSDEEKEGLEGSKAGDSKRSINEQLSLALANADKEGNASLWVQNCSYENFQYQNRRWLNELGQLVRVEFLLKRGYPPANIYIL